MKLMDWGRRLCVPPTVVSMRTARDSANQVSITARAIAKRQEAPTLAPYLIHRWLWDSGGVSVVADCSFLSGIGKTIKIHFHRRDSSTFVVKNKKTAVENMKNAKWPVSMI